MEDSKTANNSLSDSISFSFSNLALTMADTRKVNVYKAKLAQKAERYEDMAEFMEKVVTAAAGDIKAVTVKELDLLSFAYRNVIEARLKSWSNICSVEQKEESRGGGDNEKRVALIKIYKSKIEAEIRSVCRGVLKLLDSTLIKSAFSSVSKVFYLKMKGDYHSYLTQFETGVDWKEAASFSFCAYRAAQEIAVAELAPTDPIRLHLANSFSQFYHRVFDSPDSAYTLAKQAYDEAKAELDTLRGEPNHATVSIMRSLHENFSEWTPQNDSIVPIIPTSVSRVEREQPIWAFVHNSLKSLAVIFYSSCCLRMP